MSKQTINVGTAANDGTGDTLRAGFGKAQSNFEELYLALAQGLITFAGPTAARIYTLPDAAGTIALLASDQTLTNKRLVPRSVSVAFASSVTPNGDTTDILEVGALTANITITNPSGTPNDGQKFIIRFAQDGTGSRTLTWGSAFAFGTDVTAALIPSTASAKWEMVFQWNAGDSKWRAVGIARGF